MRTAKATNALAQTAQTRGARTSGQLTTKKLVSLVDGNLIGMEEGAHDIRLVSHHGDEPAASEEGPEGRGLNDADLDTARQLAEFHRMLAAELTPHSQIRGLVLRCAGHWSRLGAIPRNGLAEVERREQS